MNHLTAKDMDKVRERSARSDRQYERSKRALLWIVGAVVLAYLILLVLLFSTDKGTIPPSEDPAVTDTLQKKMVPDGTWQPTELEP